MTKNQYKQKFELDFNWPCKETHINPVWVASLSPISKYDIDQQIRIYQKYIHKNVALITTGCITPNWKDKEMKGPIIRMIGQKSKYKSPEGFFIFGPWEENTLNADIGVNLIIKMREKLKIPIVANVAGRSKTEGWNELIDELYDAGVNAFEVANSCPNFSSSYDKNLFKETLNLCDLIYKKTKLPISLKLPVIYDTRQLQYIIKKIGQTKISQLTVFDAPKSLCPPTILNKISYPFPNLNFLCFGSSHGPWDRFLLYMSIGLIQKMLENKDIKISAVGGIMSGENALELLSLGADSVQISSTLFWNGIGVLDEIIKKVGSYLKNQSDFFKNEKLKIYTNAEEALIETFGQRYSLKWNESNPIVETDFSKCTNCGLCCDLPCFARFLENNQIFYRNDLCSGCGWCAQICPHEAIKMIYNER